MVLLANGLSRSICLPVLQPCHVHRERVPSCANILPAPVVCTLADLSYDIYHATIDSNPQEGTAQQEYYVRCVVCVCMRA